MTENQKSNRPNRTNPVFVAIIALLAAGMAVAAAFMLVNIKERKHEQGNPFFKVVEIHDDTQDPAVWGKNFPLQYDGYLRTTDMQRTRYGGSEAMPRTPSQVDPRSTVAQSKLEEDSRLKTMWAGYAFSVDFREERGHAYMLEDQTLTERQRVVTQPGTCIHCHASTYLAYKQLGDGDITLGFEKLNQMPYSEARKHVTHPVACIDCHDPLSMSLRVTRPAFIEGMRAWKASQGIVDYDVNQDASRQEMRTYVCGQCHVEYYFQGSQKRLVYPWADGIKVEDIMEYYDRQKFKDWTHKNSSAQTLKAQHPEFEMWNQGIHARSGVACADCHMPYRRVGAQKISEHHVKSPLLSINRSCQTCHHFSEQEIKARVESIQTRTYNLRNLAMDALVSLITDIQTIQAVNPNHPGLPTARYLQRRAQFYLDFVEAENSTGFHAPSEAVRILAESIDYARQGQIVLRDASYTPNVSIVAIEQ